MNLVPVDLAYEDHGEGLPVVFLHGFPLNRTIWHPLIPLLKEQARLILPDLRGFGESPVTDGVYSMRLLAEDVLQLLNRLEMERVTLVGHSMGGYVALAFAHAYPNRLASLGLVSSQTEADSPEKRQKRIVNARNVRARGVRVLAKNLPDQLTDDPALASEIKQLILQSDPKAVIGSLQGMAEREDASAWLPAIRVPTLVLAGEQDKIVSVEAPQTFVRFIPRGWLVTVPGAGHMPMLEAPDRVARGVKRLVQYAALVEEHS